MGTAERRKELIRLLCRRRYETISNLAEEFGVSIRTIQRDIDTLSRTEPIYTQAGRFGGGVYVTENYSLYELYLSEYEIQLLKKLLHAEETREKSTLDANEKDLLKKMINQYQKPRTNQERG